MRSQKRCDVKRNVRNHLGTVAGTPADCRNCYAFARVFSFRPAHGCRRNPLAAIEFAPIHWFRPSQTRFVQVDESSTLLRVFVV